MFTQPASDTQAFRQLRYLAPPEAVYPEEAINGHRAFIARRRDLRPSEEYRSPTEEEWEEFLGHFERRKVALGDCGRAYGTSCIHEHSCFSELWGRSVPKPLICSYLKPIW